MFIFYIFTEFICSKIVCVCVCVWSLWSFLSIVSCHLRTTVSDLPFQFRCPILSCLIAVARISNTMLNKSGENGLPCLVLDIRGKAFIFPPLTMMLTVDLSHMDFIMMRCVPSILTLLRVYFVKMLNFLECFLCIY